MKEENEYTPLRLRAHRHNVYNDWSFNKFVILFDAIWMIVINITVPSYYLRVASTVTNIQFALYVITIISLIVITLQFLFNIFRKFYKITSEKIEYTNFNGYTIIQYSFNFLDLSLMFLLCLFVGFNHTLDNTSIVIMIITRLFLKLITKFTLYVFDTGTIECGNTQFNCEEEVEIFKYLIAKTDIYDMAKVQEKFNLDYIAFKRQQINYEARLKKQKEEEERKQKLAIEQKERIKNRKPPTQIPLQIPNVSSFVNIDLSN